ncbi:MAG TPA: serine hydrolase domain-containing protein [Bryobacteraceae bacterium]|jgi:CubicO group peptidase (beta-lactamase class C family)
MRKTLRWTTFALGIAMAALPVAAASVQAAKPEELGLSAERLQRIHEAIERHIAAGDVSGAVTLVARRGRIAHFEAQGLMNIESKKPMQKDALFRIASMSKPITGTAILMLMEEGKIRLTDPVSKFIPEFKGMKVAVAREGGPGGRGRGGAAAEPQFYTIPATREITIRDLLSHVSGLVSGPISTAEANKSGRKPTDTLADYIPRLGATPLEFQPGSRWSYSPSAGFDTLGRIVEIVSGEPFDRFLRDRIFDPLEMKDTTFYPVESQAPRVATRYQKTANGLTKQETNPPSSVYFSGAGGLSSTAEDYEQFAQMLANGGQLNGKRLLSPKTVDLMSSVHAPDTLPGRAPGRSFGLSVQVVNNAVAANYRVSDGSYGWDGAFGTHFWIDPKEKVVGILMVQTSNQEVMRDFENAVMQAMLE